MKRFVQTVSFLALVFIFGGVDALAQNVTKIDANVPFDFIAGDRYFSAGEYVIRIGAAPGGAKQVEIRWTSGEVVHTMLVSASGDTARGRAELVFDRKSGAAVLTKILTENAGYSVPTVDISGLTASAN